MNDSTTAQGQTTAQPRSRSRGRRALLAIVLAGGLATGGAGIAMAASTPVAADGSASVSAPAVQGQDGQQAPAPQPHLDGTVVSVSDGSFTIQDRDGFTRTIATTGDTTYSSAPAGPQGGSATPPSPPTGDRGSAPAAPSDGASASAAPSDASAPAAPAAPSDGASAPAAPSAPPAPPAEGEQGATADRGDVLTEGAHVHATGTVNSDGTTLDATSVSLAPAPPVGSPAGGPGAGPGAGPAGGPAGDARGKGGPEADAKGAPAAPGADGTATAPAAPQGEESAPTGS